MFEAHNQLSSLPSAKHEGGTGSSTRGRKRKNAGGGAASGSSSGKMYRAQQQQQQQQQGGFHPGGIRQNSNQFGGPRGTFGPSGGQMLPPSLMQSSRQSTGMGFGLPLEKDSSDFILDDLDTLSARDLAMARYRRNDELLNLVFDARRIDSLEPPESPYAQIDQSALQERLKEGQAEIDKLRDEHNERFKRLKEDAAKQDAELHSVVKRAKLSAAEAAPATVEEEGVDEEEIPEEWAREPSKGRIIGLGYIRATTPDEVRALLPKAPEPPAAPILAPAQPAVNTAESSTTVKVDEATGQAASVVAEAVPAVAGGDVISQPDGTAEVADSSMSVPQDDTEMTGVTVNSEDEDAEDDEDDDDEEDEEGDEDDDGEEEDDEEGEEEDADEDAAGDDADADADADADDDADGDADADADVDVEAAAEAAAGEGGDPASEEAAGDVVDVSLPQATDESLVLEEATAAAAAPVLLAEESVAPAPSDEEIIATGVPEQQQAESLDLEMQEVPTAAETTAEEASAAIVPATALAVEEAPIIASEPSVAETVPVPEEPAPIELPPVDAAVVLEGEEQAEAGEDSIAPEQEPQA